MSKRGPSLLEVCVLRAGFREGGRVARFIIEWAICEQELGREVSTEEFAAWWTDSRATAYRRLHAFREVFPGEDTPHAIAARLGKAPKVSHLATVAA